MKAKKLAIILTSMCLLAFMLKSVVIANENTDSYQPNLSDFEYTCVYNLSGDIVPEVKTYLRLTPPAKMAYISEEDETPKLVISELKVKLPSTGCSSETCEGLTLLGFDEKFVFQKPTTIDGKVYYQIKTGHREKYLCSQGIE